MVRKVSACGTLGARPVCTRSGQQKLTLSQAHAITSVDAPPSVTTLDEHAAHQSTTPASFDIPPVLRHHEKAARVRCNPAPSHFADAAGLESSEGITADVYVTEAAVVVFDPIKSKGFSIPYPAITLHAISRTPMRSATGELADTGLAGGSCLYCQLDEFAEGGDGDEADANGKDEESTSTRDLIITPTQASNVEPIFEALSLCASLHPSDDPDEEGGLGEWTGEAPDDEDSNEIARAARAHMDALIAGIETPDHHERFDDAEDTPER